MRLRAGRAELNHRFFPFFTSFHLHGDLGRVIIRRLPPANHSGSSGPHDPVAAAVSSTDSASQRSFHLTFQCQWSIFNAFLVPFL